MISNGSMPASRSGTCETSRSSPTPPFDGHLAGAGRKSRGAEVLQRHHAGLLDQLEAALDQLALLQRVADLHARPLVVVALVQLGRREHAGAADAVAARAGAEQHDHVAGPGAAERTIRSDGHQADAHRVDEAVLLVRRLEVDLAADGGDADRVAVGGDAGDHALEQVARARAVGLAEAQRVEHRDRPRAEREHVAQDPADAGGGALERLDGRGVVVALDLERDSEAVARVDDARVLAGPVSTRSPSVGSLRSSLRECL